MPKRDTMHPRSRSFFSLIAALVLLGVLTAGQSPTAPAQAKPSQPTPSTDQGQAPSEKSGDVYVFRKEVDEVTLHATVVDDKNHLVTDLDRNDFTVFEDGLPQKIISFRREDIP